MQSSVMAHGSTRPPSRDEWLEFVTQPMRASPGIYCDNGLDDSLSVFAIGSWRAIDL